MKIDFSDVNQDIVLFCAFRYALGRQTYVVGSVARVIRSNWEWMPKSRREFYKKEIREAIEHNDAGNVIIDVPEWRKILDLED
jgi:hypothetical protein